MANICKLRLPPPPLNNSFPRGLRRGSAAACLLGLWVRIPPWAWMFLSYDRCVLSGRGLWGGPVTGPEESYRVRYVWVWSRNLTVKTWASAKKLIIHFTYICWFISHIEEHENIYLLHILILLLRFCYMPIRTKLINKLINKITVAGNTWRFVKDDEEQKLYIPIPKFCNLDFNIPFTFNNTHKAVSRIRQLVVFFSQLRPGFSSILVLVGFVVVNVALRVSSKCLSLPLSVSFHQFSIVGHSSATDSVWF